MSSNQDLSVPDRQQFLTKVLVLLCRTRSALRVAGFNRLSVQTFHNCGVSIDYRSATEPTDPVSRFCRETSEMMKLEKWTSVRPIQRNQLYEGSFSRSVYPLQNMDKKTGRSGPNHEYKWIDLELEMSSFIHKTGFHPLLCFFYSCAVLKFAKTFANGWKIVLVYLPSEDLVGAHASTKGKNQAQRKKNTHTQEKCGLTWSDNKNVHFAALLGNRMFVSLYGRTSSFRAQMR